MTGPRFFGKYRGVVVDNQDPRQMGRIRARVPDVLGEQDSGWAMPCVPYAGSGVGFFALPPRNALVWIEFEHGDADYPVWTGCFWASGDLPGSPLTAAVKVLKTDVATIKIDDTPGAAALSIEMRNGAKMVLDAAGIEITTGQGGKVKLSGPQVSVNDGALEVV